MHVRILQREERVYTFAEDADAKVGQVYYDVPPEVVNQWRRVLAEFWKMQGDMLFMSKTYPQIIG